MACIAIAFAQYEAPSYVEGGHEAAGYAPDAGAYDGADPAAYAGHEGGAQAYPAGYEDGATGYGVESEGAVDHGAEAYGAAGKLRSSLRSNSANCGCVCRPI